MALRAKKPEANQKPRLKGLMYASPGSGKTHFCCSLPDVYYIDTEGLEDYPHFINMLRDNGGDLVYLTELSEIIKEVKALISTKHNYKTLVIDSLSFPVGWLDQMEVERLQKKSPGTEGTEYGANVAKGKRLVYQLGIMLSNLDMNVIVTAHEKPLYKEGKEIGTTYDVSVKMAHALGSIWNLRLQGKERKLFVEKSRYPELKKHETIDFNNGYEDIKKLFGEEIFKRESETVELATSEQLAMFDRLTKLLHVTDETIQEWLRKSKSPSLESMPKTVMQKWLDRLDEKVQGKSIEEQGEAA